jgi:branched-chain amino acid transport system permease protein
MPSILLYLLLSLGTGAAYALLSNGIVAIYKGSGVLNFAQGGVAMFAAYCYVALIEAGLSKYLAVIVVMLGAAAAGGALALVVFRPLRTAPVLAKVVATLGILIALQGLATVIWGTDTKVVESLFPTHSISVGGGHSLGVDRLYMFGTAVIIAALLWGGFRFTRLGLATQAASENEMGASLLGFSPTMISAANWALGCALAALAGILISPIATLDTATLPLLVLPALAAALVGRFSSFGITTLAAFAIGWVQSWLVFSWTQQGVQTAAPFVIVIIVMVLAGRALPTRGAISEGRPPLATAGRIRIPGLVLVVAGAVVLLTVLNTTYQAAFTTSLITAVIAMSLVVLTGYVGQISLMQFTFAGLGGFITAKFATNLGIPFPLSIFAAAAVVGPIGAMLGVPALRVRGLSLAVVTLGAAVAIDAVLFQNQGWTGGLDGVPVPSAHVFGFSLDAFDHPTRYGLFALFVLVVVAIAVSNIRRSGIGRRMLAVRSNERAAAIAGVNVSAVKLQAFTISGIIAALGGGLLAYSNAFIVLGSSQFAALPSITLVTIVYIGGIASIAGAIVAGMISAGGIVYVLLSGISGFSNYYIVITGVALIWTVIAQPDGAVVAVTEQVAALKRMVGRTPSAPTPPSSPNGSVILPSVATQQMPVGVAQSTDD